MDFSFFIKNIKQIIKNYCEQNACSLDRSFAAISEGCSEFGMLSPDTLRKWYYAIDSISAMRVDKLYPLAQFLGCQVADLLMHNSFDFSKQFIYEALLKSPFYIYQYDQRKNTLSVDLLRVYKLHKYFITNDTYKAVLYDRPDNGIIFSFMNNEYFNPIFDDDPSYYKGTVFICSNSISFDFDCQKSKDKIYISLYNNMHINASSGLDSSIFYGGLAIISTLHNAALRLPLSYPAIFCNSKLNKADEHKIIDILKNKANKQAISIVPDDLELCLELIKTLLV